jgi:dTDP-4-amino-4,6-dideoxygalactose transaminase
MSAAAAIATGRISSGPCPERIAAQLGALTGVHSAWPVNAGRTAIWLALLAMRKLAPAKNRVIVPAYLCPGVTDAVERAGLSWTLADIGDDLNADPAAIRAVLDDRTLAVIVPHMYGCPARVAEIEGMCRSAGVFMIDDAAQVVGVEHGGRMLGSFGDAGILSFAQSKTIVTGIRGSGGVLLVSNRSLDEAVRETYARLPRARGRLAQLAYFLCADLVLPRLGPPGYYLGRMAEALAPTTERRDYYAPARMSNLDAAIALRQATRLPALRGAKISLAGLFAGELRRIEGVRFPQYAPGRYLTRFMLAAPDGVDVGRLRTDLRGAGVQTRPCYRALALAGHSPANAEGWSRRLVEVPGRITMSVREVREVCDALDCALHGSAAPGVVQPRSGTTA